MEIENRPWWLGYVVTLISEAALTAGLVALQPHFPLGDYPISYIVLLFGIAYWFGEGPAILALVLGLLTYDYFFVPPVGTTWPTGLRLHGWAKFTAFFLGAGIVALATVGMRRSQRRALMLAGELRESEARFALAQSSGEFGSFDYDPVSDSIRWSETIFGLYGMSPSEPAPRFSEWLRTIHPDDREQVATGVAQTMRDGTLYDAEFRVVWPDGTIRWLLTRARAFVDKSGRPTRAVGVSTDITEMVELRSTIQRQLVLLQQALAPPKPSVGSGYEIGAVYLPASPGVDIGGDFYDVFRTENGRIAVLIGDVAGKGIEAASLAAAARSTIRSFGYELSSGGAALSHADAVLESEAGESGRFVTVFLAIIDPATGGLSYAGAGHPPAAVRRTDGRVEFLECGDPPIGLVSGQRYEESEGQLDSGDKIVLYTDGILEARIGEEIFDAQGIEQALIEHGDGTPDDVASALLEAARDWAGGRLRDDVAIVVLECPSLSEGPNE